MLMHDLKVACLMFDCTLGRRRFGNDPFWKLTPHFGGGGGLLRTPARDGSVRQGCAVGEDADGAACCDAGRGERAIIGEHAGQNLLLRRS